ncbi:MAG: hypothetical protein JXR34_12595, partial [Bacteroidales bacterium]|nr:hypothetical protein [Bacteroidales bacterium]
MKKLTFSIMFLVLFVFGFGQTTNFKLNYFAKRNIKCVLEVDSVIWIGTDAGLIWFNTIKNNYRVVSKGPVSAFTGVQILKKDNKGIIYVLTGDNKLYRYSAKVFKEIPIPDLVLSNPDIIIKGDFVFLTDFNKYNSLKNKLFKIQNNVVTTVIDSLLLKLKYQCVDSKGNMWFLDMKTRELMKYDFVKWYNYGFNKDDYSWGKEAEYSFNNHTKFNFIEENESKVFVYTEYDYQFQVASKEGGNISWLNRYRFLNERIPGLYSSKLVLDNNQNPYFLTDSGFFWFDGSIWQVKKLNYTVVDMVFLSDNTPVLSLQYGDNRYSYSEKCSYSIAKWVGDTLSFIVKDLDAEVDLFIHRKKLYGISESMMLIIDGNKCLRKSLSDLDFFYLFDGIFDKKSSSWYLSTSNGIFQYKNNKIYKISFYNSESDEWQFTDYFNDIELFNNTFYAVSSYNNYSLDEASLKNRGGMTYIKDYSVKRVAFVHDKIFDGTVLCSCNNKLWMHSNGHKASMTFLDTNNDRAFDSLAVYSNAATILDMQCRNGVELYNLYIDGIQIVRNDSVFDYFNDS